MTDTSSTILYEAEHLVKSSGFNGFSYSDIASKLGIKKASVHYHYCNKEELGIAILDKQISDFETWCFHMDQKPVSSLEKVRSYIRRSEFYIKDGNSVPPVIMLQAEISKLPDTMKQLIKEYGKIEHIWLKQTFLKTVENNEIPSYHNPSQLALMVGSFIQGATQVGRTFGVDYYRTATSQLFNLIKNQQ